MPCMKCESLIPTGMSIRLGNGLMCPDCLPPVKVDFIRDRMHVNLSNWYYYKVLDYTTDTHKYILTDNLTDDSYQYLRGVYYVHPLDQTELENASDLDRCEYLILNSGCKVYSTYLSNCTVIAMGDLEMYNSRAYSCYIGENGKHIILNSSSISYLRGLRGGYPVIDLTLDNASMPDDCSESYIRDFVGLNLVGDLAVHNGYTTFTAKLEDCSLTQLHFCCSVQTLSLVNSTVNDYDTEDYTTGSLVMNNSSIALYNSNSIGETLLINSRIIDIPVQNCMMCNKPIRRSNHLIVKGQRVHQECMRRGSYSFRDFVTVGQSTKLPPFGFELELRHGQYKEPQEYVDVLYDLIMHGFKRCSDSTVNDEMKSPILRSDKWVLDIAPVLNSVAKSYIDDHCGTHIHVASNSYVLAFLRRKKGMFDALSEYMHEHEDSTIHIWGRYFNQHYAQFQIDTDDRTSWLNITGSNHQTVEYRLAQMRDVEQFQRLIYFCRLLTLKLHKIHDDYSNRRIVYTSKIGADLLRFYQKFEANTLKGVK